MTNPLASLMATIAELDRLDTVDLNGAQWRLSKTVLLVPCDGDGYLIGIDAEVLNFHAQRVQMRVQRSRHLAAGQFFFMKTSDTIYERSIFNL